MKVYEFYQDELNYYVVTEFIKGGELFDRFEQMDHLSEKEAANGNSFSSRLPAEQVDTCAILRPIHERN